MYSLDMILNFFCYFSRIAKLKHDDNSDRPSRLLNDSIRLMNLSNYNSHVSLFHYENKSEQQI